MEGREQRAENRGRRKRFGNPKSPDPKSDNRYPISDIDRIRNPVSEIRNPILEIENPNPQTDIRQTSLIRVLVNQPAAQAVLVLELDEKPAYQRVLQRQLGVVLAEKVVAARA